MELRYEVWMGFKNYLGEVYDVELIAVFNSESRAKAYLDLCKSTADDSEVYAYRER